MVVFGCLCEGDPYLVFAVAVATCWSSCHADVFEYDTALPANDEWL